MFVIVKQESFAAVSVGILKLLFPVLLLAEWGDKRFEVSVHMKVMFWSYFITRLELFFFIIIVNVFKSRDFTVTLCCLCCSAKACWNVFLTDASSYLPRAVVGFKLRGQRICDPPETYAPCPLALHYDRAQTHEREVIANGRRGQGSYLSQNGFSTAVHRSLHEHMTNNHYIELRYVVISWYSLWYFFFSFFFL